ncbi:MAG TPA: UDP-N-acetylmuramoyl-tripeptide--D-alanyl-D-alanine ligase [Dehalococcoidia bacterium]|nr:UDP-N-acetylmuramoyl-tripeptide--D-alanyl-D-alanine ligase [Dehalococcoidia bacterium]
MIALSRREVAQDLGPALVACSGSLDGSPFTGAAIDSRRVREGDLFFALRGQRHDGHDFIPQALAAGARGLVVARPFPDRPDGVTVYQVSDTARALQLLAAARRDRHPSLKVVGVTGSVGKTTCKELVASVLSRRYRVLKSEGNLNTEVGLPLSLLGLTVEHEVAVLEMAMFGRGDIALLCSIARPQLGVVTNIGPVHLERLGSLGAIAAAKGELVEALPANGAAVVNGDCPWAQRLLARSRARTVLYGRSRQCQVRGEVLSSHGLEGFTFRLCWQGREATVRSPMPGRHNLHNLLAAAAVALELGMGWQEVVEALAHARSDLRLRVVPGPGGSIIIDDSYNASPASVVAALDLLAEMPGRRIALLGDMLELGEAAEDGHRQVGAHAARTTHKLLVLGEMAPAMAAAALAAGHHDVQVLADKDEAVAILARELRAGDWLLVKASRALALETVVEALAR